MTVFLSSDIMGGGEMPYKVPDWKIYQVGKHTPELEQVQRMLSSMGLKVMIMNYDGRTIYLVALSF